MKRERTWRKMWKRKGGKKVIDVVEYKEMKGGEKEKL